MSSFLLLPPPSSPSFFPAREELEALEAREGHYHVWFVVHVCELVWTELDSARLVEFGGQVFANIPSSEVTHLWYKWNMVVDKRLATLCTVAEQLPLQRFICPSRSSTYVKPLFQ